MMTNWEKFKETFNIPDEIKPMDELCEILYCEDVNCKDCILGYGDFWSQEYKEE